MYVRALSVCVCVEWEVIWRQWDPQRPPRREASQYCTMRACPKGLELTESVQGLGDCALWAPWLQGAALRHKPGSPECLRLGHP